MVAFYSAVLIAFPPMDFFIIYPFHDDLWGVFCFLNSIPGMTKVKVGKEDSSSAEFLEKRRAALER